MAAPYRAVLDEALRAFGSVSIPSIDAKFHKEKSLGSGSFGSCWRIRPKLPNGQPDLSAAPLVLKEINKDRVAKNDAAVQHVCAELAVTGLVAPGSPYLNKRVGLFHDKETFFILLELAGGPRPDVLTRVAHVIAKRAPSRLAEIDSIMDGLRSAAQAAGVDPDNEEAFGDFVDTKSFTINGDKRSHIEKIALDMGLAKINSGNFAEMPVADTLFNFIVGPRVVPDEHSRIFHQQMLKGFEHLHGAAIVSRDAKPENVVCSIIRKAVLQRDAANGNKVTGVVFYERCGLQIIDFGLAKVMRLASGKVHDSPGAYLRAELAHREDVQKQQMEQEAAVAEAAKKAHQQQQAEDEEDDDPYAEKNTSHVAALKTGDAVHANEVVGQQKPGGFKVASTCLGSHAYVAFEGVNGILSAIKGHQQRWETTSDLLTALDVWAVGCTAFCCANGCPPFRYDDAYRRLSSEEKLRQVRDAILRGLQWRSTASSEAKRFITLLMNHDPTKRPTAAQALQDPFVAHNCTVVRTECKVGQNLADGRRQMMRDFPAEVAKAVLEQVAAAKRNDFPESMLMHMVRAAFPSSKNRSGQSSARGGAGAAAEQQQQQQQQQKEQSIIADPAVTAAEAAADEEQQVEALKEMANVMKMARHQEDPGQPAAAK